MIVARTANDFFMNDVDYHVYLLNLEVVLLFRRKRVVASGGEYTAPWNFTFSRQGPSDTDKTFSEKRVVLFSESIISSSEGLLFTIQVGEG